MGKCCNLSNFKEIKQNCAKLLISYKCKLVYLNLQQYITNCPPTELLVS